MSTTGTRRGERPSLSPPSDKSPSATTLAALSRSLTVLEAHRKYTQLLSLKIERTTIARRASARPPPPDPPPQEDASPPLLAQLRSFSPFGKKPSLPDDQAGKSPSPSVDLDRIRSDPAPSSRFSHAGRPRRPPRKGSLARLSLAPVAERAQKARRTLLAEAGGDEPRGGLWVRRLQLKSRHLKLVRWWLLGSIGLTLVAFFTTSFTISVEGLVGNIIDSQPGQSSRQSFSFFSMGDVLGESAPAIGGAVLQAHTATSSSSCAA